MCPDMNPSLPATHQALAYLLRRLEEHDGTILQPVSFRDQTVIRNAGGFTENNAGNAPMLITEELVQAITDCPAADGRAPTLSRQMANTQTRFGETLLMRIVRHAFKDVDTVAGPSPLLVRHLLEAGADPLVCCDAGKNVLHDLIWCAVPGDKSAAPAVAKATREVFASILKAAGREGMLALLLCQERHHTTPCEYFTAAHTCWKELLESVVTYGARKGYRCLPLRKDQTLPKDMHHGKRARSSEDSKGDAQSPTGDSEILEDDLGSDSSKSDTNQESRVQKSDSSQENRQTRAKKAKKVTNINE